MSKAKDLLRTADVYNPYEFYGTTPYLWFRPRYDRDPIPAGWMVNQRGVDLNDGNGHWADQGNKKFSGRKRDELEPALAWARERFGIEEWKRDPFGSYGPAPFVDARLAALAKRAKDMERGS